MNDSRADERDDLAMIYAADLADDTERASVERRLAAGDPATAAAVAEARAVLADFAVASVRPLAPSAAQWKRLSAQVKAASRPARPMVLRSGEARWPAILAAAAAAAVLAGGIAFSVTWQGVAEANRATVALRDEVTAGQARADALAADVAASDERLRVQKAEARQQADALLAQIVDAQRLVAEQESRAVVASAEAVEQRRRTAVLAGELEEATRQLQLVSEPDLGLVRLGGTDAMPDVVGRAFVSTARNRVRVSVANLGQPAAGRTYQLWVIPQGEGQKPVSLGTFPVAGGAATLDVPLPALNAPPAAVAISDAPAGGTPQPSGPIVALGKVGGD